MMMRVHALLLSLLWLTAFTISTSHEDKIITNSTLCNVLDYGAKGDNKTDDTTAIQTGLNQCPTNSIIYFPSNYSFKSYPLTLTRSNLTIHIDNNCQLQAMPNIDNWPIDSSQYTNFLSFSNIQNIKLTGNGVINGNGQLWWPLYKSNSLKYRRPNLLQVSNVTNLFISSLTFLNSPMFHIDLTQNSSHVLIDSINITVTDPGYSNAPNTDGIDIGAEYVEIQNSFVQNGDDSYVIKPGGKHVIVQDSVAKLGLGIDVGTNAAPTIHNVTFLNMTLIETGYGIRLKSHYYENGSMSQIKFINISMIDVENAIDINQYNEAITVEKEYNLLFGRNQSYQALKFTKMYDITFTNISGTYENYAGSFACSPIVTCNDLLFENIDLKGTRSFSANWTCMNAYGTAINVIPALTCLQQ